MSVESSISVLKAAYPDTGWDPFPLVHLFGPLECRAFEWRCDVVWDPSSGRVSEDAWRVQFWWNGGKAQSRMFRKGDVFHILKSYDGWPVDGRRRALALMHADGSTRELHDWERFSRELGGSSSAA